MLKIWRFDSIRKPIPRFLIVCVVLQSCYFKISLGETRHCEPLNSDEKLLQCISPEGKVSTCKNPQVTGTIAKYKCKPHYAFYETVALDIGFRKTDNKEEEMKCNSNRKWTSYSRFQTLGCREDCGKRRTNPKPLIINGVATNSSEWPWHAAIFRKKGGEFLYICGGSVISRVSVLTAAHCSTTQNGGKLPPDSTMVVIGAFSSNFSDNHNRLETQIFKVKKIFVSESYDIRKEFQADIAILQLARNIEYNDHVSPICLPNDFTADSAALKPGKLGDAVGFGLDETGTISKTPKHGILEIKSHSECFIKLQRILTESQFCAGSIRGTSGKDRAVVCNGDSGGGLFLPSIITEKYYIHGIVSTGELSSKREICQNDAVFTRVYSFIFWIRDILEEMNENAGVLKLVGSTAFPYSQRESATKRNSFIPISPEWKNKVTSIELLNVDVDPDVFLRSLEDSKTVQFINFTQVKFKKSFPLRKVQLPLLKSISLDILRDDWVVRIDRTPPVVLSKDFLSSLIFFEKDFVGESGELDFGSQIVPMKTDFDLTIHIFKPFTLNHELGKLSLFQIPFTNEILGNLQEFHLRHLALSKCSVKITILRNMSFTHQNLEGLVLDKITTPPNELSDWLKTLSNLKEFVYIALEQTNIEVSNIPKSLKHLALTRINLTYKGLGSTPSTSTRSPNHSSSIIFPAHPVVRWTGRQNLLIFKDMETFYCEECYFDMNFAKKLPNLFPNLKKIVLIKSTLLELGALSSIKGIELIFIMSADDYRKKIVKQNDGNLREEHLKVWYPAYVHFNYELNHKDHFWSSEADFVGLKRLSPAERDGYFTGRYTFNGHRVPYANGSIPPVRNIEEDRFPFIALRIQHRLETIEILNAEVGKTNIEESLKFAKRLKHLVLTNISSNDIVQFRTRAILPNLEEYRVVCFSGDFLLRFGYKGYAIILESIYQYIFPFQDRAVFNSTFLQTYVKRIHLQHAQCVEVSWDSVEGSLVSGMSFTNDWLKNLPPTRNSLKKLAFKYGELDSSAVPRTLTHLNLNFVILKYTGELLQRLNGLRDLRLVNVRVGDTEEGAKEWEWTSLYWTDLFLHSPSLEYLTLQRTHVKNYRSGISFPNVKVACFDQCTFQDAFIQDFKSVFPGLRRVAIMTEQPTILLAALRNKHIVWLLSSTKVFASSDNVQVKQEIEFILKNAKLHVIHDKEKFFIVARRNESWHAVTIDDSSAVSLLDEMKGYKDFGRDPKCHAHSFDGVKSVQINAAILKEYLGYLQQKN